MAFMYWASSMASCNSSIFSFDLDFSFYFVGTDGVDLLKLCAETEFNIGFLLGDKSLHETSYLFSEDRVFKNKNLLE